MKGKQLHSYMITNGLLLDNTYLCTRLAAMYALCGDMDDAHLVFDRIVLKSLLVWNIMIRGYAAIRLFACGHLNLLKKGREIHGHIVVHEFESDLFVGNSLLSMYVKCRDMESASQMFHKMPNRDMTSWNTMRMGHAQNVESLRLFHWIRNEERVQPDIVPGVTVLGACGRLAALECGRCIRSYLIRIGFTSDVIVGTALVDFYAKCGSLEGAQLVFSEIPEKNLVSWNWVTFTSVLSACAHSGLVEKGKRLFDRMLHEFSIEPRIEHCVCMVDLFGRAGHLDEAYDFIKNMKIRPNSDVWAALLAACRVHKNFELVDMIADHMLHLKPDDGDIAMVRSMMRENGLKKPPGCSFVELGQKIYHFMVGETSHPQSEEIYAKLRELRQTLKEAGYIPDTSYVIYDVGEEVKLKLLETHSEKLAIAFVLINTSQQTPVRITKNLRVCGDCHTVTKLISNIVNRDIIVRDAHRCHHFRNGSCTCGDFW
ncbi:hypothetical protein AMTRI_Chr02g258990 [Amborella trichopoda]